MSNKLYLLTTDSYIGGYGVNVVCLGIFSSLKKANEAKEQALANVTPMNMCDGYFKEVMKHIKDSMEITELTLNETGRFTEFDKWGDYLLGDDKVKDLGGYAE